MACYTKNISLPLVERISQRVVRGKHHSYKSLTNHSYVRFSCPIRALQSYNGALLEYRMPICGPDNRDCKWRHKAGDCVIVFAEKLPLSPRLLYLERKVAAADGRILQLWIRGAEIN
ncbi:hypothetical protein AVEN_259311-1 [Araneus ventricosus]|uniref:Uncharacterized protein n=1 Tax=Araneus ventricosus TaxID=182803 RepID=A0A4Y2GJI3_ARAVE|nr:hypothetical protein AVEN_259311-1 [Araneus ventricosus]